MRPMILMISDNPDAVRCAAFLSKKLRTAIEVVKNRRAGLSILSRGEFKMVMIDAQLAAKNADVTDRLWLHMQMAIPLLFHMPNFDCSHLLREIEAGFIRRERELALARRSVKVAVEGELKTFVTGILLESQLALGEEGVSPAMQKRLRHLSELAGVMQQTLRVETAN